MSKYVSEKIEGTQNTRKKVSLAHFGGRKEKLKRNSFERFHHVQYTIGKMNNTYPMHDSLQERHHQGLFT